MGCGVLEIRMRTFLHPIFLVACVNSAHHVFGAECITSPPEKPAQSTPTVTFWVFSLNIMKIESSLVFLHLV